MKQTDVIRWLSDELDTALSNSDVVTLTNRGPHIGLANARPEGLYPFIGIDYDGGDPRSAGIGADTTFVDSKSFDENGILESITYRRDTELDVTVHVLTDGDRERRDNLADDIQGHLHILARTDDYPSDMSEFAVGDANPSSRPDEFVYGDGTSLELEYSTFWVDDQPDVAKDVNIDIEVADDASGTNSSTAFTDLVD